MLTRRVIVCLDVRDGRVVKGVEFRSLRDVGDPVELCRRYEAEGADEIVFLDVSASSEGRGTMLDAARRSAERLFIPLTIGGGVRRVEDVSAALRAGADKVSVNTAAVARPGIITESAARFGSQCVVASVDAKRHGGRWIVYTHGGRVATGLDAIEWARTCAELGAGEILLTSMDRDGTRVGYDIDLTSAVASVVDVPVIASGGAGAPEHVADVLLEAGAEAALVAGIVHDGAVSIASIKRLMRDRRVPVRPIAA